MRIITQLLDSIFPPRDSEALVRTCTALPSTNGHFQNTPFLLSLRDQTVHAAIHENKYHDNETARLLLATALQKWYEENKRHIIFIPIPLNRRRERARGYNQVTEILKKANLPILTEVLVKTKDTVSQTTLNKSERLKNVTGVFTASALKLPADLENITIVIIDDVITTGATLNEARATLAPHLPPSARLLTLALAH